MTTAHPPQAAQARTTETSSPVMDLFLDGAAAIGECVHGRHLSAHQHAPRCRQLTGSLSASRPAARAMTRADGRISGLWGWRMASLPGVSQAGKAWPRSP